MALTRSILTFGRLMKAIQSQRTLSLFGNDTAIKLSFYNQMLINPYIFSTRSQKQFDKFALIFNEEKPSYQRLLVTDIRYNGKGKVKKNHSPKIKELEDHEEIDYRKFKEQQSDQDLIRMVINDCPDFEIIMLYNLKKELSFEFGNLRLDEDLPILYENDEILPP